MDTGDATFDTEGSRRMAALPGSLRELAAQVGCSAQTIANWRRGTKVPDEHYRALIQTAWGIQVQAWAVAPHTALANADELPAPPNGHAPDDEDGPLPTTLERCLEQLTALRRMSRDVRLLPRERLKYADTEAKWLQMRIRLEEKQELLEDRLVREHPAWQMFKRRLLKALKSHKEAALAVAAELSEIDNPTSANAGTVAIQSEAERSAVNA